MNKKCSVCGEFMKKCKGGYKCFCVQGIPLEKALNNCKRAYEEPIIIWQDIHNDYDDNAKVKGFVETKRISLYRSNVEMPTDFSKGINPKVPCLLFETINQEQGFLEPIDFIELSDENTNKIIKFLEDSTLNVHTKDNLKEGNKK